VRRIETLQEHLAGLEIMLASANWDARAAAAERMRAEEVYERRTRRGGYQWLAWSQGRPVAFAMADRAAAGLYLSGGSTLPEARGRGCYRALVRARWDEAARLGTPGLAVQAQYGTSAPILRRLGFAEVASIHTLQ
jgi:GNAT superfamily N-acetyltransferase